MIPIGDTVPGRNPPVAVWLLILANSLVFLIELAMPPPAREAFFHLFGVVPARFTYPDYWPVVTSLFIHGSWPHIISNMLALWIFGDNVEDRMGHGRFLVFYLLCGVAAALAQTIAAPDSMLPMIGASGAIAGVMGAYFVLYPKSRIVTLVTLFIFFQVVEVPAIFFLGIWFVMQFLSGVGSIVSATSGEPGGGVAFWAHVAGFVAGISGVLVFRRPERQRVEWWHDV